MLQKFTKAIKTGFRAILNDLRQTIPYGVLLLLISISLFVLLVGLTRSNSYGIYLTHWLRWGIIFVPIFYIPAAILLNRLFLPRLRSQPKRARLNLFLLSLLITAIVAWILPTPLPAISSQHTLKIVSTGAKSLNSTGAVIEIQKLRFINGATVPISL